MGLGGLVFQALKTVFGNVEVMLSILSFFVTYSLVFTLLGVYRRTKEQKGAKYIVGNMSSAFDFDFFWGNFGFLLKLAAPFAVIMVSIYAVGKLLEVIIRAVKSKGSS